MRRPGKVRCCLRTFLQSASGLVVFAALSACSGLPPGSSSAQIETRGKPGIARESAQQESQRIKAQRESAAQSGLIVLSAGAASPSGQVMLKLVPVSPAGKAQWLTVQLNCQPNCLVRKLAVSGKTISTGNNLAVVKLAPGRWQIGEVRYNRGVLPVSGQHPFEVRNGYATYLGGFYIRPAGGKKDGVRVLRYSAMQQDMTRALGAFPAVRGRRLINTVNKLRQPVLLH